MEKNNKDMQKKLFKLDSSQKFYYFRHGKFHYVVSKWHAIFHAILISFGLVICGAILIPLVITPILDLCLDALIK